MTPHLCVMYMMVKYYSILCIHRMIVARGRGGYWRPTQENTRDARGSAKHVQAWFPGGALWSQENGIARDLLSLIGMAKAAS